jgi:hypothetical protein
MVLHARVCGRVGSCPIKLAHSECVVRVKKRKPQPQGWGFCFGATPLFVIPSELEGSAVLEATQREGALLSGILFSSKTVRSLRIAHPATVTVKGVVITTIWKRQAFNTVGRHASLTKPRRLLITHGATVAVKRVVITTIWKCQSLNA